MRQFYLGSFVDVTLISSCFGRRLGPDIQLLAKDEITTYTVKWQAEIPSAVFLFKYKPLGWSRPGLHW